MDLSIIIPVYNEEANIEPLYNKLISVLEHEKYSFEIIFINDGSIDKTREKLNLTAEKDIRVKVIHLRSNFGKTKAMKAGIDMSAGDVIISLDGDLQNDPEDILKVLSGLAEGYDICSGWRRERKDNPVTRTIPSIIANKLISCISGVHLHDYGCGLKAYKKHVIKDLNLYGEMHRFLPLYACLKGAKITEVPVKHHRRINGNSKYGLERILKVILDLMFVKFMETYGQNLLYFFGNFGLINFLFSFITFLLTVKYYGWTSFIQSPLFGLLLFFIFMGCQSIFLGFITEIFVKIYYETQNKPVYLIEERINL